MQYSVYILYSEKLKKYYIGTTNDVKKRLIEHNESRYNNAYTLKGIPWKIIFEINELSSNQAYKIELHIKKMKSKIYIQNLIKYPEMKKKLILKYD